MGCLLAGARSATLREGCAHGVVQCRSCQGLKHLGELRRSQTTSLWSVCKQYCWPCNAANLNEISTGATKPCR